MNLALSTVEVRILGCLIEKQATTPDAYPLTLNGLVAACNQKSSREPVRNMDESEVLAALDTLMENKLASTYQSGRNRVVKYQHKLHQRLFDEFNFSLPELAVLCVQFLRGPQTSAEIRTRCSRIYEFPNSDAVTDVLGGLVENSHGPYVTMLPRQVGRKEARYAHLFCGEVTEAVSPELSGSRSAATGNAAVEELELQVNALREKLVDLESRFEKFVDQFE